MVATARTSELDRREGRAAIGVDVGGTKVALGLLEASSLELLTHREIPTGRGRGGAAVLASVTRATAELATVAAARGSEVIGIGLGMPEIVDPAGRITSSAVIPDWNRLPVAAQLGAIAPLRVEADVRAAALAEAVLGMGREFGYFVFVILGTGISHCAVIDGRPFPGAHGGALNVGTSRLDLLEGDAASRLVLERIASGSALVERFVNRGGVGTRAEDVLRAAASGDESACSVVDEGTRAFGVGIALLVNLFDPQAVIVGGGLGSADTEYVARAAEVARPLLFSGAPAGLPILRSSLGPHGGTIGAALVGLLRE